MMNTTKRVAIMAITAALYTAFFALSIMVTLPNFTLLYLPIILLGVFPIWFGWSGLVGSMIGGFIVGAFGEQLYFFGWVEAICALIIYGLNWLLIARNAAEAKTKKSLVMLIGAYALSLFVGLGYLLWQETFLPALWTPEVALSVFVPTYALNIVIAAIICPALIRTLSPKLRSWGMYSGTFDEWRNRKKVVNGQENS